MKKIFIIFIFILLSNCQISYAKESSIIDEIENNRQACLNKNYQSDYIMAQCNYTAIDKYNIEIKTLLEEIKAILPESKYSILLNSQTTWSNFIESDNLALDTILESEIYFEPYLISSGIKYQNKKHRYEELITLYKYLNIN